LSKEELAQLRELLTRRAAREPLAYLLGEREFFALSFEVGPSVLIPRPESEALVEKAVAHLDRFPEREPWVLDLGTGSGCLAVAIAHERPLAKVWAVDLSPDALEVARRNAQRHGVQDRVFFRQGSWWEALETGDPAHFLVVVANPPYIGEGEKGELSPEILRFEPHSALFATKDGLSDYLAIQAGLSGHLAPEVGAAYLELNSNISDKIMPIWQGYRIEVDKDIHGLPRLLSLFLSDVLDRP
jgi:release factor glutamine methyltransferase